MFDFDDDNFNLGPRSRAPPSQRQWVVTCEPSTAVRHKIPRGSGRKKTRLKPRHQDLDGSPVQGQQEGLQLPPHLLRYGVSRKHAFCPPSLLGVERDEGKVEFKLLLKDPTPTRFQQLVTQLKYRLSEGEGECFYFLGVEDNGNPKGLHPDELQQSLAVLHAMALEAGATTALLRLPVVEGSRKCAVVRVKLRCTVGLDHHDLRVAVAGGVDSGKTTLVAVLTHGREGRPLLDNGRGSARMAVFRHKHEIETGHTSSISQQALGYDAAGSPINYAGVAASYTPAEVALASVRVVRFVDTGGHEKYSKTALYGMTCMLPDYAMICACAAAGVGWVTREHLAVALALGLPPFIVLTKADLVEEAALDSLVGDIRYLLCAAAQQDPSSGAPHPEAIAPLVESEEQARKLAPQLLHSRIAVGQGGGRELLVPIFKLSSVSGRGLAALHSFLYALHPQVASLKAPVVDVACSAPGSASLAAPDADVACSGIEAGHPGGFAAADDVAWGADGLERGGGVQGAARQGPESAAADEAGGSLAGLSLAEAALSGSSGVGGSTSAQASAPTEGILAAAAPASTALHDLKHGSYQSNSSSSQASWAQPGEGSSEAEVVGSGRGGKAASSSHAASHTSMLPHFQIDSSFFVSGVGPVYSGRVVSGTLCLGSRLLLGHCGVGSSSGSSASAGFLRATVVGLHRSQMPVQFIELGHIATVAVELEGAPSLAAPLPVSALEAAAAAAAAAAAGPAVAAAGQPSCAAGTAAAGVTPAPAAVAAGSGVVSEGEPHAAPVAPESVGPSAAAALPTRTAVPVPAAGAATAAHGGPPDAAVAWWELTGHMEGPGSAGEAAASAQCPSRPAFPKGAVLLDPGFFPEAHWEFEAVLVLLGGHWPARGLMSGRWPPEEGAEAALGDYSPSQQDPLPIHSVSAGAGGSSRSMEARGSSKRPPSVYTAVVHCGSIRQAAQVTCIQEMASPSQLRDSLLPSASNAAAPSSGKGYACAAGDPRILPAFAAARLLRAAGWVPSGVVGSQGSLPRLSSSSGGGWGGYAGGSPAGPFGGGSPSFGSGGWAGLRGGSSPSSAAAFAGSWGQGGLGHSPGSSSEGLDAGEVLGYSQGAISNAWSGDSIGVSCTSSDSGESSSSEGGRGGGDSPAMRERVGWAERVSSRASGAEAWPCAEAAAAPDSSSSSLERAQAVRHDGSGGGGSFPLQVAQGHVHAGPQRSLRGLARHPSLSAARHDPDLGCLARVRLRFVRWPEWLVEGARLVVRDRGGGRAAAVGYVLSAGPPA